MEHVLQEKKDTQYFLTPKVLIPNVKLSATFAVEIYHIDCCLKIVVCISFATLVVSYDLFKFSHRLRWYFTIRKDCWRTPSPSFFLLISVAYSIMSVGEKKKKCQLLFCTNNYFCLSRCKQAKVVAKALIILFIVSLYETVLYLNWIVRVVMNKIK